MLQVSVYRFNPETDAAPQMQEYQVETGGKDLMVLDVLEMIKAEHDARLASSAQTSKTLDINKRTPVTRCEIEAYAVTGSFMVLISRLTGRLSLLPRGFT